MKRTFTEHDDRQEIPYWGLKKGNFRQLSGKWYSSYGKLVLLFFALLAGGRYKVFLVNCTHIDNKVDLPRPDVETVYHPVMPGSGAN